MGAKATGYGCGVAVGDFDDDGRPDLYVGNVGPNQLLRNRGDGTFDDVTARAGVGDPGTGVATLFFDYDRDGWLDLFVGNYVAFDNTGATVCRSLTGAPDYCGPGAYPFQPDRLYHNRGDGTFEDVTVAAGIARDTAAAHPGRRRRRLRRRRLARPLRRQRRRAQPPVDQPPRRHLPERGAAGRRRGQRQRRRPRPAWGWTPATSTATATSTSSSPT